MTDQNDAAKSYMSFLVLHYCIAFGKMNEIKNLKIIGDVIFLRKYFLCSVLAMPERKDYKNNVTVIKENTFANNRPYVMGRMFHGKNAAGGGANNAIKSIVTRSGIKIVFNDDQKSLHIADASGNTWDMDGKGNIAVNAPKNMTITIGENLDVSVGKNVTLNAGENISVDAGGIINESAGSNIVQSAGGNIMETTENKKEIVEKVLQRTAEKLVSVAEGITTFSTEENMVLQSKKTVKMNSAEKTNFF